LSTLQKIIDKICTVRAVKEKRALYKKDIDMFKVSVLANIVKAKYTNYAYERFLVQLLLSLNYTVTEYVGFFEIIYGDTNEKKKIVTITNGIWNCSCSYSTISGIPCRHIICTLGRINQKTLENVKFNTRWLIRPTLEEKSGFITTKLTGEDDWMFENAENKKRLYEDIRKRGISCPGTENNNINPKPTSSVNQNKTILKLNKSPKKVEDGQNTSTIINNINLNVPCSVITTNNPILTSNKCFE
jgi:hypothetical protein